MSSNWLPLIRKASLDPLAARFRALSDQLAQFDSHNVQIESTDMPNEIKVDNSIVSYSETSLVLQKFISTKFFLPFEPDLKFLTLWYKFDQWSKTIADESFFGNDGTIAGGNIKSGSDGPDKGFGPSVCISFDGSQQNIQTADNPTLRMVATIGSYTNASFINKSYNIIGVTVGFSVAALVFPTTFSPTITGQFRYIASKVDDFNNMWVLFFDASGKVHFWIYSNGASRSVKTTGLVQSGVWHWIVATFNAATNASLIYVDGAVVATVSDTPTESPGLTGDFAHAVTDLFIGSNSGHDGHFHGFLSDFRYYREMVLDQFMVANLNANFYSISAIPFAQVLISGAGMINPGLGPLPTVPNIPGSHFSGKFTTPEFF